MDGWSGKVLRVDLSKGQWEDEELDIDLAQEYLGGRGLATKVFFDEVDANVDPLSPENKLIFATGPLTGTGAPTAGRYMVVSKSPLTGTIACCNVGGDFGSELKYAGYDMVIFEGKSPEPVYLMIQNGDVQIKPAGHLWGKKTNETDDMVKAEMGDKWKALDTHVACIGPAGEKLARIACIMSDKHRAAGRSGLGAVMGSKNLKAIAVWGSGAVTVTDGGALKEATFGILGLLKNERIIEGMTTYGSMNSQFAMNRMGVLPALNFQAGSFEGVANTNARPLRANLLIRNGACFACPIACSRVTRIRDAEWQGEGYGPEFETCSLLGPDCGVDDLAAITKANYICNELGIDTMSAGGTIACAMELYEKGYLKQEEVGYELNFGNAKAMVELVEKLGLRQGFGDVLAEGGYRLAEKYGHPELFMGVKKQEMPAYHPQGLQGEGLALATANGGASHNRAGVYASELWGYPYKTDPLAIEGKAAMCVEFQHHKAVLDAVGVCQYIVFGKVEAEHIVPLLNAATGMDYTVESLMLAGEKIWNLERLFNLAAGFTAKDDTLPKRLLEQPMLTGTFEGQVSRLGEMLPEYYQLRGWDENGVPTKEKLAELGLD
jgi:aldehyde:ferredoxin oxidoreductase